MTADLREIFAARLAQGVAHEQSKAIRNYDRVVAHLRGSHSVTVSREYTIPGEMLSMLLYAEVAYHLRPGRSGGPTTHRALAELLERDSVMPPELRTKVFENVRRTCREAAAVRPSSFQQTVFSVLQVRPPCAKADPLAPRHLRWI